MSCPKCRTGTFFSICSLSALLILCVSRALRFSVFLWLFFIGLFILSLLDGSTHRKNAPLKTSATFVAVLLLMFFSLCFYSTMRMGKPIEMIQRILPSQKAATITLLAGIFVLSVVAFRSAYIFSEKLVCLVKPVVQLIQSMYKHFVWLAAIYIVALFTIIRANFYYVDDLARAVEGYSLVGDFSRYFAGGLAFIVHGNVWLTDISPLPQILAAIAMAVAAIIVLYTIKGSTTFRILDIVSMIPFGIFPYFLTCLSYKYDALYMALSVLVSVIPLLFAEKSATKYIISACLSTISMCTLYQVSSGIFPMCVAMLCFVFWFKGKPMLDIIKFCAKSMLGYISGLLVFRFAIMDGISSGNYVNTAISLKSFPSNISRYFEYVMTDFNYLWLAVFALVTICFVITVILFSKRNKWGCGCIAVITVIIVFVLSNGVYNVFESPITSPRAMYGVGIFFSLLCICSVTYSNKVYSNVAVCSLAWLVFVFSFTYGNALSVQKEYTDFRIEQALTDIQEFVTADQEKIVVISGEIGFATAIENMAEEYPVLERQVQVMFAGTNWYWGDYQLLNYYGANELKHNTDNVDVSKLNLSLWKDTMYHTLYGNEDVIYIVLK